MALTITYVSGIRKEECFSLERTRVNFITGYIQLDPLNTKTNEPRGFFMRGEYYEELLAWEQRTRKEFPDCKYVIHWKGSRIKDFRESWDTSLFKLGLSIKHKCKDCKKITERKQGMKREEMKCEHCGSENLRRDDQIFHDLRRTGVINLIDSGVNEKDAMYISGHKTRSMLDRYKITKKKNLEDAADKMYVYLKQQEELYRNKNVKET